jgi:hypothetical protein
MTKRESGSTTVGARSAVATTRIGMVPLPTCRSSVPSGFVSLARSRLTTAGRTSPSVACGALMMWTSSREDLERDRTLVDEPVEALEG